MECGHENVESKNQNGPLANKYSCVAAKEQQTMCMARCLLPLPRISAAAVPLSSILTSRRAVAPMAAVSAPAVRKVSSPPARPLLFKLFSTPQKITEHAHALGAMKHDDDAAQGRQSKAALRSHIMVVINKNMRVRGSAGYELISSSRMGYQPDRTSAIFWHMTGVGSQQHGEEKRERGCVRPQAVILIK